MMSCTKPNLDVVMALVKNGANMKLTNKDGWNCFHITAREGHTDILSYLLDCCDDIWDTCSKNGRTPLHSAGYSDSEIKQVFSHTVRSKQYQEQGTIPLLL